MQKRGFSKAITAGGAAMLLGASLPWFSWLVAPHLDIPGSTVIPLVLLNALFFLLVVYFQREIRAQTPANQQYLITFGLAFGLWFLFPLFISLQSADLFVARLSILDWFFTTPYWSLFSFVTPALTFSVVYLLVATMVLALEEQSNAA